MRINFRHGAEVRLPGATGLPEPTPLSKQETCPTKRTGLCKASPTKHWLFLNRAEDVDHAKSTSLTERKKL
jgi:hypothetical protein